MSQLFLKCVPLLAEEAHHPAYNTGTGSCYLEDIDMMSVPCVLLQLDGDTYSKIDYHRKHFILDLLHKYSPCTCMC